LGGYFLDFPASSSWVLDHHAQLLLVSLIIPVEDTPESPFYLTPLSSLGREPSPVIASHERSLCLNMWPMPFKDLLFILWLPWAKSKGD
jgi:hypothetical protein